MTRAADTTIAADEKQIEALRSMGEEGRFQATLRLIELAREASKNGIRARHPRYTDDEVHLAFARLVLGDALVGTVWPGRPLVDP